MQFEIIDLVVVVHQELGLVHEKIDEVVLVVVNIIDLVVHQTIETHVLLFDHIVGHLVVVGDAEADNVFMLVEVLRVVQSLIMHLVLDEQK